jgi:hypothetical protein
MRQGKLTPSERAETECELRRLVAHERWEWMPGMLFEPRDVDRATIDEWPEAYRARVTNRGLGRPDAWIPIPSDPATAGCLMDMLLRDRCEDVEALTFTLVADAMWPVGRCMGEAVVRVLLDGWEVGAAR